MSRATCTGAVRPTRCAADACQRERAAWLGGALAGLLVALWLYGWDIAVPTHVGWLLQGGDIASHFLGWDMFRRDTWHWPPGANPHFGDISPNTVVFSDSLPLLALPLKLFHSVLPDPFQYQGLILFINFMLNGAFAALLGYRLGGRIGPALVMSVFVATATIVSSRGQGGHGHETLTAHWLILAAFILAWTCEQTSARRLSRLWTLLILVSALTHFYLLAMVLAIWATDCACRFVAMPAIRRGLLAHALAVALLLPGMMYLAGYFSGAGGVPSAAGFGQFSANLLTFLDPASTAWYFHASPGVASMSAFLPDLPELGGGQYEGHAYMGLGLLVVVAAGTVCWLCEGRVRLSRGAGVLVFAAMMLALAAFSNVIAVGGREVVHVSLWGPLATLAGVVRSSGRFIWVLFYLLAFGGFAGIVRNLRPSVAMGLLLAALVLQLADLAPWHAYLHQASRNNLDAPREIDDPSINAMMTGARRMVFVPVNSSPDGYVLFSYIAARHGMAVNATYSARTSEAMLAKDNEVQIGKLRDGDVPADEVFVVGEGAGVTQAACARLGIACLRLNDSLVIMRAREGLRQAR